MDPPELLEDTNRRIHELERKLSFVLTSSLTHTNQSHGSVVHDASVAGMARDNIQLSVLRYIRENSREFDADRVYADRQQHFITKFAREYSPSTGSGAGAPESGIRGLEPGAGNGAAATAFSGPESPLGSSLSADFQNRTDPPFVRASAVSTLPNSQEHTVRHVRGDIGGELHDSAAVASLEPHETSLDPDNAESHRTSIYDDENYASDTYDDYYDGEFDSGDDDYGDDDYGNDFEDDFDSDNDMLLPPLPPRLPPREMDPDKLYGLYDFSGPDPLHCTLSRDEPVFLMNDLDNYWWLIRKMTKAERVALNHVRGLEERVLSDDEDGKVGFVPAECLETFGERLARLNCYKNEELERSSRDTLPMEYFQDGSAEWNLESDERASQGKQDSSQDFERVLEQEGKQDQKTSANGQNEPFGGLLDDASALQSAQNSKHEISNSPDDLAREAPLQGPMEKQAPVELGRKGSILKKSRGYRQSNKLVTFENLGDLNLDDDDIDDDMDFSEHYLHIGPDDIAPSAGMSLQVPRSLESEADKASEVLSDVYPAELPLSVTKNARKLSEDALFMQPKPFAASENDSIGSFSPDTPPTSGFVSEREIPSSLRRSEILDRLLRVTSDIQEQLGDDDPHFGGALDTNDLGSLVYSEYQHEESHNNSSSESLHNGARKTDETGLSSQKVDLGLSFDDYATYQEIQQFHDYNGSALESEDGPKPEGDTDTPLTSVNSLNNLALPITPLPDIRQVKPVHDMFMPILGKLDELTEKLAELEHHLL